MPQFDFASMVQEREEYSIVLSRTYTEDGEIESEDKIVLPPVLPAKLMLKYFNKDRKELERMQGSQQEQMKVGMEVIENLLGEEDWDRLTSVIGFQNIPDLLQDIFDYYGLKDRSKDEEEEGKAQTAEAADPSQLTISSTISEPSTPTLNGFIPVAGNGSTEESSTGNTSSPESDISPPSHSS